MNRRERPQRILDADGARRRARTEPDVPALWLGFRRLLVGLGRLEFRGFRRRGDERVRVIGLARIVRFFAERRNFNLQCSSVRTS